MEIIKDSHIIQDFLARPEIRQVFPDHYQKQLRLVVYGADEAICQQDDQLTALSLVVKGKVKIVRRLFNGKDYILDISTHPNLIGDIELLTGQAIVSSVIALDKVWVVQLPLSNRQELLSDSTFLYMVGKGLATSLYQQNIQAASNIGYSVKERLATHILSIENQGHFQPELHLMADSFGTSYRHLLRTIKDFLEKNIISKQGKNYQICDRKTLEKLRIHP